MANSGHVSRFTDLMVKDVKTGQGHRADKLISEWIENKLIKDKKKLKEEEVLKFKKIQIQLDSMKKQ